MRNNNRKVKFKFSADEIKRVNRLFESEEQEKKVQEKPTAEFDKNKASELLAQGSYIDFKQIPENKRKDVLASFKKAGLQMQKTTAKSIAKIIPALGNAYKKNSEKVNTILALGIAAGILCQFGIDIDTCCASAGIALSPKMIEILKELYTDFDINDEI